MSTTQTPEYTITTGRGGVTILWQGQTFEVEVEDLEAGGWEFEPECERDHCDDGDCPGCDRCGERDELADSDLVESVTRWHEAEHRHALRFCEHPICTAMSRTTGERHG